MIRYPKAIHDAWLPICAVKEIGRKPLRRLLHGQPFVVFKGADGPAILRDDAVRQIRTSLSLPRKT